jgi:hypothetical protein
MSSDFLLTKIPLFSLTEERKIILEDELENMTPENYELLRDELFFEDETDEEIIHESMSLIDDVMNFGFDSSVIHDHEYNHKGDRMQMMYAGGDSWGDSPSDAYDSISAVLNLPIYSLLEQFATEDCKVTS